MHTILETNSGTILSSNAAKLSFMYLAFIQKSEISFLFLDWRLNRNFVQIEGTVWTTLLYESKCVVYIIFYSTYLYIQYIHNNKNILYVIEIAVASIWSSARTPTLLSTHACTLVWVFSHILARLYWVKNSEPLFQGWGNMAISIPLECHTWILFTISGAFEMSKIT